MFLPGFRDLVKEGWVKILDELTMIHPTMAGGNIYAADDPELHDYPLARFIALAKMLQVVDGSAEIQRIVIARDLMRRPSH